MADVYITTAAAGEIPWISLTKADNVTYMDPSAPSDANLIRPWITSAGILKAISSTTTYTYVEKDATQTLTGKTLTSPTVNSPTISGGTINNAVIGGVTPAAATVTALTATTGTFTDIVNITKTTQQLSLNYDGSNKTAFTVSSGGDLTIAPTGGDTTITGTLTVNAGSTATALAVSSGVSAASMITNLTNSAAVNAANAVEIDATLTTSTTSNVVAASVTVVFSDTTHATRTSTVTFNGSDSGTFAAALTLTGRKVGVTPSATIASAAGATWKGFNVQAATATVTGSTNITTATGFNLFEIAQPTITSSSALTVSLAATLRIIGAPLAAGSTTITTGYSLWVTSARFDGTVTLSDVSLNLGTSTGTKIGLATSQKLGLWNATPIVQPTTGVAAATFVANAGTAVNDASTFDGYTMGQVVKALRNMGALA